MLIAFGPQFELGHAVIDHQHMELFGILNRLHDAMKERRASEVMTRTFNDLEKYVRLHFKTEETLMQRHAYPGTAAHRAAHDEFVNRLLELYSDFERGRVVVAMEAAAFLRSWLTGHIPVADRQLCEYVRGRPA